MLKKNLSKSALVVALLTTTVIWRGTTAYAEDPNQAFTLDPMIVTAQRTETRDLDTPATVMQVFLPPCISREAVLISSRFSHSLQTPLNSDL